MTIPYRTASSFQLIKNSPSKHRGCFPVDSSATEVRGWSCSCWAQFIMSAPLKPLRTWTCRIRDHPPYILSFMSIFQLGKPNPLKKPHKTTEPLWAPHTAISREGSGLSLGSSWSSSDLPKAQQPSELGAAMALAMGWASLGRPGFRSHIPAIYSSPWNAERAGLTGWDPTPDLPAGFHPLGCQKQLCIITQLTNAQEATVMLVCNCLLNYGIMRPSSVTLRGCTVTVNKGAVTASCVLGSLYPAKGARSHKFSTKLQQLSKYQQIIAHEGKKNK